MVLLFRLICFSLWGKIESFLVIFRRMTFIQSRKGELSRFKLRDVYDSIIVFFFFLVIGISQDDFEAKGLTMVSWKQGPPILSFLAIGCKWQPWKVERQKHRTLPDLNQKPYRVQSIQF